MGLGDFLKRAGLDAATGGLYEGYRALDADKRSNNEYSGVDRGNYDLPGFAGMTSQAQQLGQQFGSRSAPLSAGTQIDPTFRQGQLGLMDMLQQQASGTGPSLAAMQLRQAADQNINAQQALAQSGGPGNAAMAARMASQNAARINQGLAGQTAQAQLAERLGAMGALGNFLSGARGQDINAAQLGQQNQQFNAGQQLQQAGLNQQGQLAALGQQAQLAGMQQAGGMGYEQNRAGRFGGMLGVPTTGEELLNAGAGALGMLAGGKGK